MLDLLAFGPDGWGDEILAGLEVTLLLAVTTAPVALVLGFLLALARRSRRWWLRAFGDAFTTVFKGLPELLTLFIVYYGGQILIAKVVRLFHDGYVEVSAFAAGVVALGVVAASYASEIFMAALGAIPRGQYEAASALGISRLAILWKVILPQVMKVALPGLGNVWLVLLKDTALVSVIALPDLLRRTQIAVGVTKEPFFFYTVALLLYLFFSLVSVLVLSRLEARFGRGTLPLAK